jgi:hypothetical protein
LSELDETTPQSINKIPTAMNHNYVIGAICFLVSWLFIIFLPMGLPLCYDEVGLRCFLPMALVFCFGSIIEGIIIGYITDDKRKMTTFASISAAISLIVLSIEVFGVYLMMLGDTLTWEIGIFVLGVLGTSGNIILTSRITLKIRKSKQLKNNP